MKNMTHKHDSLLLPPLIAQDSQKLAVNRVTTNNSTRQTNKWVVFIVTAIGVFVATLDSSIVNISLPAIASSFGVPLNGAVTWVSVAYLIVTASTLLTAGRLADMLGRKPVWTTGLVVFTLSSMLCGAVPSLALLIAMRALQGIGGALMLSVSPAMITSGFPANERGRAIGLSQVNVALAVSVGPVLGGLILAILSWRWIFYVNVPLGIICIIATWTLLKEPPQRTKGTFDLSGAALLAVSLAAITLYLTFGQDLGWTTPTALLILAIGIVSLVVLGVVEQHSVSPLLDRLLLKSRIFLSALSSYVLAMMALFAVSFVLPFYLEQLRGFSPQLSGLLLTPLPIAIACVAPFSGGLADRFGTRWLAVAGLAVSAIGLVALSLINVESSTWDIIWRLVLIGIGQALFQSPNSSAILGAAPQNRQGVASGFLATSRVVGQSISVALAGAIFTGLGGAVAGRQLELQHTFSAGANAQVTGLQQIFLSGFRATLLTCATIAVLGIVTSLVRGKESIKSSNPT